MYLKINEYDFFDQTFFIIWQFDNEMEQNITSFHSYLVDIPL